MLRTLARRHIQPRLCIRYKSTIPFDTKPFPYSRFEPCCPEQDSRSFPNGFVPCKHHPIPNVLGGKIDFENDMQRPASTRHCVVCVGDGPEWSRAKVEAIQDGMVNAISNLEKDRSLARPANSNYAEQQLLTTVCDRPSATTWPSCDVMLFPEFKRHVAANPKDLPRSTVSSALFGPLNDANAEIRADHSVVDISADTIVLVCTHERRDMRCGKIGPLIVEEFRTLLSKKKIGNVEVWGTSHFGGHKFAGNVIIHQRGMGGHMYGNVRQCHVDSIIDRHIVHQKVIKEIWRGQVA